MPGVVKVVAVRDGESDTEATEPTFKSGLRKRLYSLGEQLALTVGTDDMEKCRKRSDSLRPPAPVPSHSGSRLLFRGVLSASAPRTRDQSIFAFWLLIVIPWLLGRACDCWFLALQPAAASAAVGRVLHRWGCSRA